MMKMCIPYHIYFIGKEKCEYIVMLIYLSIENSKDSISSWKYKCSDAKLFTSLEQNRQWNFSWLLHLQCWQRFVCSVIAPMTFTFLVIYFIIWGIHLWTSFVKIVFMYTIVYYLDKFLLFYTRYVIFALYNLIHDASWKYIQDCYAYLIIYHFAVLQ